MFISHRLTINNDSLEFILEFSTVVNRNVLAEPLWPGQECRKGKTGMSGKDISTRKGLAGLEGKDKADRTG
jgi:hypothetical protein